jgi:hypothetical protein
MHDTILIILSRLFQNRKGSTRTGVKYDPATGSEVCQFVYVRVGCYLRDLTGAVDVRKVPAGI